MPTCDYFLMGSFINYDFNDPAYSCNTYTNFIVTNVRSIFGCHFKHNVYGQLQGIPLLDLLSGLLLQQLDIMVRLIKIRYIWFGDGFSIRTK